MTTTARRHLFTGTAGGSASPMTATSSSTVEARAQTGSSASPAFPLARPPPLSASRVRIRPRVAVTPSPIGSLPVANSTPGMRPTTSGMATRPGMPTTPLPSTKRVGIARSYMRLPPFQRLMVMLSFTSVGLVGLYWIDKVVVDAPVTSTSAAMTTTTSTASTLSSPIPSTHAPGGNILTRFIAWTMTMVKRDMERDFQHNNATDDKRDRNNEGRDVAAASVKDEHR